MPKIILHLKAGDTNPELNGWHLRLYRRILSLGRTEGIPVEIRARDRDIRVGTRHVVDSRFDDGNLHIIDDRSVAAKGVLNAGVAYFWEFWHLDPIGVKAFSSIGQKPYEPEAVSTKRIQNFASNLRRKYVEKRVSKYDQTQMRKPIPANAVSIFFQGSYPAATGATAHTDLDLVIATQKAVGDQPIIVKPHPFSSNGSDIHKIKALAEKDERIILTDANVHDILERSTCTVSINSTVALEGYLHRVPAVLCGTSDFHHITHSALDLSELSKALKNARTADVDFDRYLAWYFLRNCLHIKSGKLDEKIWERFASAGFPRERFG